ncbi:hypothetical protein SAMN05216371_4323 [Streptomyces sp. TLI_053]|nr:hypothetical protein SAMN05216371_4323 [Streptomyces sp. TLI_053]
MSRAAGPVAAARPEYRHRAEADPTTAPGADDFRNRASA